MTYVLLFLIGVAAGHRAGIALAAVALGAWLGWIDLSSTWAAFADSIITVIVLVVLAVAEAWRDKQPGTGSRLEAPSLVVRAVAGALAGAVLGLPSGNLVAGIVLGAVGAVAGAFEGFYLRRFMARLLGRDLYAALLEDVITAVIALLVVYFA
jgi:uncharacterized membrane protein